MIATTSRGAPLPSVEDVARRIGVALDPTSTGVTVGEAWSAGLADKKRLRASLHERLEVAGTHWILPAIRDVPLERLNGAHRERTVLRRLAHGIPVVNLIFTASAAYRRRKPRVAARSAVVARSWVPSFL